jgi:4-hydroxy 2-oxovalerate aldolase
MDSAGYFAPKDVKERVDALKNALEIEVGFHAHNNLGVAVTNATSAVEAGAMIIDGASMGLGTGAGNAQLENIVAVSSRQGNQLSPIADFLEMSRLVEESYPQFLPSTTSSSIQSGLAGVFSGCAPQVKLLSLEMGI